MRSVNVNGSSYTVKPVPPRLSPVHIRVSDLMNASPKSIDEAISQSKELEKGLEILFGATISPLPKQDDTTVLFKELMAETQATIKDANSFREKTESDAAQSRTASANHT